MALAAEVRFFPTSKFSYALIKDALRGCVRTWSRKSTASIGLCRPSGTRLLLFTLPGTDVPGYRLCRPSGTRLLLFTLPGTGRAGLQVIPSLRDWFIAPSTQGFIRKSGGGEMYLSGVMAVSFMGRNDAVP
jgi:hypothetical protein